jgi:rubredoxin
MGYSFDYFVGNLKCPVCGAVSEADESTNMQTYIRDEPDLAYLGVGHPLEIKTETMKDKHYLTIRLPQPGEEICLLDIWECPICGHPFNWAEIVILDGIINTVKAVPLNREVFEKANFISQECISVVAELTGRSFRDLIGTDLVYLLRERL